MEGLRIVFQRLLIEGATRRVHALIARLHRYLIRAVLLFLLLLIVVEESALHRVPVINDCLHGVVLLVRVHQGIDFIVVRLVLHDLYLVLRRREVVRIVRLLPRLFESADNFLLLVRVSVRYAALILRFDYICSAFGGTLLLGGLLVAAVVRVVYLSICVRLSVFAFIVRVVVLAFQVRLVRLHIRRHVVRLQVVLVLHNKHVIVGDQVVRLIRNGIVKLIVEIVVAVVVLLGGLENILDLVFEFQVLLQLLLLVLVVHHLLVLDQLLSLVLLADRLVNHVSFVEKNFYPFVDIVVFEVSACHLALEVEATVLVIVL